MPHIQPDRDPNALTNRPFASFRVDRVTLTKGVLSVQAEDGNIDRRKIPNIDWVVPECPLQRYVVHG
jgi:hypothetical protein